MLTIEEVVNQVLNRMEKEGNLMCSTIKRYRQSSFNHVIRYFHEHHEIFYNERLINDYLDNVYYKFENHLIGPFRVREMKRVVYLIKDYVSENDYVARYDSNKMKYMPCEEYLLIADNIVNKIDCSKSHKESIHVELRKFLCFIEHRKLQLANIDNDTIIGYLNIIKQSSSTTIGYAKLSIKHLSELLEQDYQTKFINVSLIPSKRKYSEMILPYSKEELKKMMMCIDTCLTRREKAIVLLALFTGIRGCDIRNLKTDNIHWSTKKLVFRQTKTNKNIEIPLTGKVMNAIAEYIIHEKPAADIKSDEKYLFLTTLAPRKRIESTASLRSIINKLEKHANIEHKHLRNFHSCRRSFATLLIDEEIEYTTVSQLLGHSDFSTDKRYILFNSKKVSKCSMSFKNIPINGGVYYGI